MEIFPIHLSLRAYYQYKDDNHRSNSINGNSSSNIDTMKHDDVEILRVKKNEKKRQIYNSNNIV